MKTTRQSGVYLVSSMARPRRSTDKGTMMSSVEEPAETSEVVVKFTARYNHEAHLLLAKEGLAPMLHACA